MMSFQSLLSSRRTKRAKWQGLRGLVVETLEQRRALTTMVAMPDAYTISANASFFAGPTGQTSLTMRSDQGDWVGQGKNYFFDETTGRFCIEPEYESRGLDNGVMISFVGYELPGDLWSLAFSAPAGSALKNSVYVDAMRSAFKEQGRPGLDVSGNSRGSNTIKGAFEIHRVDILTGGAPQRFHATFEQHSEAASPALRGEIRMNEPSQSPGVLANDSGGSGSTLRSVLVAASTHGRVALKADGSFTYRPNENYLGPDSFRYQVTDGFQTSDPVTVTINVVSDAPTKLAFFTTAADVKAGESQEIRVAVQDSDGNTATEDNLTTVTLEVASGPGRLLGVTSVTVINGIATFPAAAFEKAGAYTLRARSGAVAEISNVFLVAPSAAAGLSITSMSSSGQAGTQIQPAIRVSVVDRYGNVVTSAPKQLITINVASGPDGFVSPSGTKAWTAAGTATFNAFMLRKPGAYTFRVTSAGIASLITPPFVVFAPTRTSLQITRLWELASRAVSLTARVSFGRYVVGGPTKGSVSFFNGETLLGTAKLMGGKATLRLQGLPSGANRIRAVFNGGDGFAGSGSDIVTYAVKPFFRPA